MSWNKSSNYNNMHGATIKKNTSMLIVTFPNGNDLSSKIPKLPHEEVNLSVYNAPGV
jgi:hypothetical protein